MEQKDFEQIIEDYDFACQVAKRCENKLDLSSLYKLFDKLGYRTYNFSENELFDMEIGNLILTYSVELGGIDKTIQVWYDEDLTWYDTDIEDFENNLGLAMLSYTTYKNNFYKDHDHCDEPVCFDEFLQNEWQDEEVKDYYTAQSKNTTCKKKYIISILYHDDIQEDSGDDNWYSDCVYHIFNDYEKAKECIRVMVKDELESLKNDEVYSYGVDESTLDEQGDIQIDRFKNGLFDTLISRYTIHEF